MNNAYPHLTGGSLSNYTAPQLQLQQDSASPFSFQLPTSNSRPSSPRGGHSGYGGGNGSGSGLGHFGYTGTGTGTPTSGSRSSIVDNSTGEQGQGHWSSPDQLIGGVGYLVSSSSGGAGPSTMATNSGSLKRPRPIGSTSAGGLSYSTPQQSRMPQQQSYPTQYHQQQNDEDDDDEDDEDDEDGEEDEDEDEEGQQESPARVIQPPSNTNSKASGSTTKKPPAKKVKVEPLVDDNGVRKKPKLTRGSRACTVCRRLKMKCVDADLDNNGPCKRCRAGGFECVFEESHRGKKSNRNRNGSSAGIGGTGSDGRGTPTIGEKVKPNYNTAGGSAGKKQKAVAGSGSSSNGNGAGAVTSGSGNGSVSNNGAGAASNGKGNGETDMERNLKKAEADLDTVLRALHNPGSASLASAMTSSPPATGPFGPVRMTSAPIVPLTRNGSSGASSSTHIPTQQNNVFTIPALPNNNNGITYAGPPDRSFNGPSPRLMDLLSPRDVEIPYIRQPKDGGNSSETLSRLLKDAPPIQASPLRDYTPLEERPSIHPMGSQVGGGTGTGTGTRAGTSVGGNSSDYLPPSPRLHSLPDNSLNPLGLLAEASLQNSRKKSMQGQQRPIISPPSKSDKGKATVGNVMEIDEENQPVRDSTARAGEQGGPPLLGVGDEHYFKPGPMTLLPLRRIFIEREVQPEILKLVSTEEVTELFQIYFTFMHRHIPVLNQEFHTPSLVCSRSPFLLTTICTIAARFYTKRPELYLKLNSYAKKLMFSVPSMGYKSVEVVQAYILLTCWCLGPEERFEQDRTWLLLGLAIRTATDLNLHRKAPLTGLDTEEGKARDREIVNRERCWLLCFVLDRSLSTQMGKPYSIREDYIIRNCHRDSWLSQEFSQPTDLPLSAYVNLQQIMSRALDTLYSSTTSASGLMVNCDYPLVLRSVQEQLDLWVSEWTSAFQSFFRHAEGNEELKKVYDASGRFYYNYSCLVLNSFGLQNALEQSPVDLPFFFSKVYHAAMNVITITINETAAFGWLKYSPDSQFVMISYAVLSLLKLIRPEFRSLHPNQSSILTRVTEMADLLASTAVDQYHTPALYAVLLKSLISSKAEELTSQTKGMVYANGIVSRPGSPTFNASGGISGGGIGGNGSTMNAQQLAALAGGGEMGVGMGMGGVFDGVGVPPGAIWNGGQPQSQGQGQGGQQQQQQQQQSGNQQQTTNAQDLANQLSQAQAQQHMRNTSAGTSMNNGYYRFLDPTMAISLPDGGGNSFGLSGGNEGGMEYPMMPSSSTNDPALNPFNTHGHSTPTAVQQANGVPVPIPSTANTPWSTSNLGMGGTGVGGPLSAGLNGPSNPFNQTGSNTGNVGNNELNNVAGNDLNAMGFLDPGSFGLGSWDSSLLMPGFGFGQLELSGGLVHGQWGSGFISPSMGVTPSQSRAQSPARTPFT